MRIPSLDGLRAISILLVVFGHLNGTRGFGRVHLPFGDIANLGVRVFFAISGFLITSLLLEELAKTDRVDLRAFYLRRVFRIFPAFYAYLGVVVACSALGVFSIPPNDLVLAATYTNNYDAVRAWPVAHIWSLSVEEQFYLLWPATIWLAGARRGLVAAGAVVMLCPLVRLAWWYVLPGHRDLIGEAFPTIADAIAVGCVLAGARDWLGRQALYVRFLRSPAFVLVPVLAFVATSFYAHARPYLLAGHTFLNISCALVIDRSIRFPTGLVGRLLNSRVLSFIGVLSYSIYLWQQPLLNRESDALLCRFPFNLIGVALLALGSYYLIERPCLRLRHRFVRAAPPASAADVAAGSMVPASERRAR